VIYLDGNSLGARPRASLARDAHEVVAMEWGQDLIVSWNRPAGSRCPSGSATGSPAHRRPPGEVVVTDTTSLNLFKALAAVSRSSADGARSATIVTERSNFPTDIYMADGLARWLDRGYSIRLVDSVDELAAAVDADCAVLMLTHVNYRTGWQHDMAAPHPPRPRSRRADGLGPGPLGRRGPARPARGGRRLRGRLHL
jgi:kynureninase